MNALNNILEIPSLKSEHPRQHADALAELAALRAERDELRRALESILNDSLWDGESREDDEFLVTGKILANARAVLAKYA